MADEVDPYQKPQELLNVSPKGLVPALMLNAFDPPRALNESTVILDFLEECVCSTHSEIPMLLSWPMAIKVSLQSQRKEASSRHQQIRIRATQHRFESTHISELCSFHRCENARPAPIRPYQPNTRACILQVSSSSRSRGSNFWE